MIHPDHRMFAEPALRAIADHVPPAVRSMLDTLIESAALAQPGVDAEVYAGELRSLAAEGARLASELDLLRR